MLTSQQTTSASGKTRVGPHEYAEAVLTVQDAAQSLQDERATGQNGIPDDTAETSIPPKPDHRQFIFPSWPTSKPGPEVTLPLPGQKPLPTRTDQMVYECYDQEHGRSCVPPPAPTAPEWSAQESGGRTQWAGWPDLFGHRRHA